jgi:hypothetical protein
VGGWTDGRVNVQVEVMQVVVYLQCLESIFLYANILSARTKEYKYIILFIADEEIVLRMFGREAVRAARQCVLLWIFF